MTNNIKYQRPLPIKAQSGRVLDLTDQAQRAKQENARRRAMSKGYFDQAPSIQNLAKGIYYWATSEPMLFGEDETPNVTKGVAPAVGTAASAVRSVPQVAKWVGQSLPGLAFLSGWLGSRTGQTIPTTQTVSRTTTISRPRLLDRAEEAASDSITPAPRDSIEPSTPPLPNSNDNEDNNNKNKKESTFKKESKKVIRNIGNIYGIALKGGAYGTGLLGAPYGIWYGIRQASKPEPTAVDSLLEQQSRQMMELNKLQQAKQNQAQIDSLRRNLYNTNSQQTPRANVTLGPVTTLSQESMDSIDNNFLRE